MDLTSKLILSIIFIVVLLGLYFYLNSKKSDPIASEVKNKNKTIDTSPGENRSIISAPIVSKYFIKKNGEQTDKLEYFARRSIQDYYIKFCESKIDVASFQKHLNSLNSEIKVLKMEIEFRKGELDICDNNKDQPSRMGEYIIIHKIL